MRQFGMKTVRSEIINIHGSRDDLDDDLPEIQDLVIATDSLPPEDWRRARVFSWMTAFLHFDKLFQLPGLIAHELAGLSYREIIEGFLNAPAEYEVIGEVRALFEREAHSIQQGGPEYVYSEEWLGIFWPADEYMFIKLTVENKLDRFYDEAGRLLEVLLEPSLRVLAPNMRRLVEGAIMEAVMLNSVLVARPHAAEDVRVSCRYNVLPFCDAMRRGQTVPLREEPAEVEIERGRSFYADLQDWCREVVWWGNKKGAYLYINRLVPVEPQLSGHY
jgi:hypothetical protein